MIVLKRPSYHASRRLTDQIRRRIQTSQDVDASMAETQLSERKVTVTKVKYSQLPTSRVLLDGSHVSPIGEWLGGLEIPETSPNLKGGNAQDGKARKRCTKKTGPPDEADTANKVIKDKPKSLRRRKGDDSTKEDVVSIVAKVKKSVRKSKVERLEIPAAAKPPTQMLGGVIMENLAKFPHCILLTRVGQFYESYFDQAIEVAHLLNIKLTSRPYNKGRIPMCGFPLTHLDKSLNILVKQNKRFVAMCEEFARFVPGMQKPEFDRRVARVITPGTLIDEPFLNQYENNYLLAVSSLEAPESVKTDLPRRVGLAWIDVSTGEFFVKSSTHEGLRDELARIGPKEIVLDKVLESNPMHPIRLVLVEESNFFSFIAPSGDGVPDHSDISSTDDVTTPAEDSSVPLIASFASHEASAINLLTTFLHSNLLEHMPTLSSPNREDTGGRMQIDAHTIRALEIRDGAAEGTTKGSLLSVIKRTVTSSGTRLLARWLCSPSTSIREINARQSLVEFFYTRPHLRDDIAQLLNAMEDASRIVQKFSLGRGNVGDLSALHTAMLVWTSVKRRIQLERKMEEKERGTILEDQWTSLDALISKMNDLCGLASRISLAVRLNANAPMDNIEQSEDGVLDEWNNEAQPAPPTKPKHSFFYGQMDWTIKPRFSEQLSDLHARFDSLLLEKETLEKELQLIHDVPSLTLRSSPGFGMHVHIQRSKRDQGKLAAVAAFVKIAESGSTTSFFYHPWSHLGGQIADTANNITIAEKEAFEVLRSEVNDLSTDLRRNARIMDELDVTLGFAQLATEMNFVRPFLTNENVYNVINGRHPTVELGLMNAGRVFTPNSVALSPNSRLHIITGPNMAGKSTFLRQIALVTILAQTGSFVPADYAILGIVDKLFSRVGAKDDLFRDRSTFMVEMLETAEILKRATSKSLVIMDEVGRGTTMKDGLAIAFATVHHLVVANRCRALFATHFHELADLLGYSNNGNGQGVFEDVGFFCTDVDEIEDGHFAYSHRMRPGVNRDSHGLKVAQLAGMPPSAVSIAKQALSWLQQARLDDVQKTVELTMLGQELTTPEDSGP